MRHSVIDDVSEEFRLVGYFNERRQSSPILNRHALLKNGHLEPLIAVSMFSKPFNINPFDIITLCFKDELVIAARLYQTRGCTRRETTAFQINTAKKLG